MKKRHFQSSKALMLLSSCSLLLACNSNPTDHSVYIECPQQRTTEMAPAVTASKLNPLVVNGDNLKAGKELFLSDAKPLACAECHGDRGDGNGPMAYMFEPRPRNFTCADDISTLPDGQLYWIIKNGSIGTSMPAFDKLSDGEIWQLTLYIRSLSQTSSKKQNSESVQSGAATLSL